MTTGGDTALTESGVRLSWADNAMHWAIPARKHIESHNFLDVQLGFLAMHLCIVRASLLVNGCSAKRCSKAVAPDTAAAGDCPIDPGDLAQLAQRVERIRDQIMHLPDGLEPGRTVNLDARREKKTIRIVGRGGKAQMADTEAIALLNDLEPWISRQREPLLALRPDDE